MSNIQSLLLGQVKYSGSLLFSGQVFADETRIGQDSPVKGRHSNEITHNENKVRQEHVRSG
jgi:hypothetical protein